MLSMSLTAMASSRDDPMNQGSIIFQNMSADMSTYTSTISKNSNSIANTSAGGTATGIGGSVNINNERPLPNAPAMSASSSNTTSLHRKLNQKTVSILFGGFTSVSMDLDIVSFVASEPNEDVQLAACIDSEQYRTFRRLKHNACPTE